METQFNTKERHDYRMIMEADIMKCKLDESFEMIEGVDLEKTKTESMGLSSANGSLIVNKDK